MFGSWWFRFDSWIPLIILDVVPHIGQRVSLENYELSLRQVRFLSTSLLLSSIIINSFWEILLVVGYHVRDMVA